MAGRVIGFTGTQIGMSSKQKRLLKRALRNATELHHGDCIGADEEADGIAREMGISVVIHPPDNPSKRAFCAQPGDIVWEPLPYLERNRDIVDCTQELIVAPKTDSEELRSGTWSTFRYARRKGKTTVLLHR